MRAGALLALLSACISIVAVNFAFGVLIVGAILARPPIHKLPGFWLALACSLWIMLSLVVSDYGTRLRPPGLAYGWPMVYLVPAALAGSPRLRRAGLVLFLVGAVATALLALAQFALGYGEEGPWRLDLEAPAWFRASGFYGHHLVFGFAMAAVLTVLATSARRLELRPGVAWLAAALALPALLASTARGAFVGLVAALAVRLGSRGLRPALVGVGAGLLVGAAGLAVLSQAHPPRAAALLRGQDVRWQIWQVTLHVIREHPVVGTGDRRSYVRAKGQQIDNGFEISSDFVREADHPHNIFLGLAVLHGLPALVLFWAWIGTLLLAVRRHARGPLAAEAFSLMLSLVVLLAVAGLTEDLISRVNSRWLLLTLLGYSLALFANAVSAAAPDDPPPAAVAPGRDV